jgi:hypothetical protein
MISGIYARATLEVLLHPPAKILSPGSLLD